VSFMGAMPFRSQCQQWKSTAPFETRTDRHSSVRERRCAEHAGQAMHDALVDQFPGLNCLELARRASGDDATGGHGKRQFHATVSMCSAWLPPYPGGVVAQTKERERRSGVTDDQRRANADALVVDL